MMVLKLTTESNFVGLEVTQSGRQGSHFLNINGNVLRPVVESYHCIEPIRTQHWMLNCVYTIFLIYRIIERDLAPKKHLNRDMLEVLKQLV